MWNHYIKGTFKTETIHSLKCSRYIYKTHWELKNTDAENYMFQNRFQMLLPHASINCFKDKDNTTSHLQK
jgi:hypothetical protein